MELEGRTVLLTGASGGIGRAAALLLSRAGARVALVARGEAPLQALAVEIAALGGEALAIPADVRRSEECVRAVEAAVRRFEAVHALVNNAGIGFLRRAGEATDAEIEEMVAVNLLGAIRMTRAALPALTAAAGAASGGGVAAIVNVASVAGRIAPAHYSYYSATKFGLAGLSESWRRELRAYGIRVTLLLPSAVETPFLERADRARALGLGPTGIVLRPEQVASAVVQALRRHPPDMYLPWFMRPLAWLNLVLPGISDRIVNALFRYPKKR